MKSEPTEPGPSLDDLLRLAAKIKITPQMLWDQRVSWAVGMLPEDSSTTREDILRVATEMYGPRPTE